MMAHFRIPPRPPMVERVRPTTMGDLQHFCLRWNNYQNSITTAFENLRGDEDFIDVTLACDGKTLKAHRVVLSACSPYFRELLKSTPCKHPVIVLQDVVFDDLHALVEFIYHGEVNVHQRNLTSFLKTAEVLKVSGLTQQNSPAPTPTSSSPSSDHFSDNLPPRFTTRSPGTPPEKGNSFQPPLFNCVPLPNSNEDRNSPRTHLQQQQRLQQNKHNRRHLRSPTPIIRSSNSRDGSPVPPMKRAKSADNHSPSRLDNSTSVSPTTVLAEDTTLRSRKNSCEGSPPSRRSSPHDTSNYDENHNDEDTALAASREEQNDPSMDPMDFSNKPSVKKFECAQLSLSNSASPNNQPLKPEPLDLVYSHPNSNNMENDNDDDDSSQWDRTSDPSPPASLLPQPYDPEDAFLNSRTFLDSSKFLEVAGPIAAAFNAQSLANFHHQQRHSLPASALIDPMNNSSQDWTELDRRGCKGPGGGGGGGVGAGVGGGPQQFGCFICGKMLSTRLTLKRHIEQQHTQPLHSAVCTICRKVFRTLNSLNNHKSIYHRKPKWSTPSSTINS